MNISALPDDPLLRDQILLEMIADQASVIADQKTEIALLAEQVRLLKALRFAAQSEKSRPQGHEIQFPLFNEAEMVADEADSAETETEIAAHARKMPGRRPISPDFPRVEVVHDIPEDEKVCACGCELTRIGEEVSEKLDVIPQKIRVIRHIRPKYACKSCEGVEDDRPTVRIAPMPPQIIPQGIVTLRPFWPISWSTSSPMGCLFIANR